MSVHVHHSIKCSIIKYVCGNFRTYRAVGIWHSVERANSQRVLIKNIEISVILRERERGGEGGR